MNRGSGSLTQEQIDQIATAHRARLLSRRIAQKSPKCCGEDDLPVQLSQDMVDAWLLKGTLSMIQWLVDQDLTPPMRQACIDTLPELEKAILVMNGDGGQASVQQFLSRMLPLLIRGITLRKIYAVAPMSNANQTQLVLLMETVRAKIAKDNAPEPGGIGTEIPDQG